MTRWQENSRCRACGHREIGTRSAFDTMCPNCGTKARWSWQLWRTVRERRVGWLRTRWEQLPTEEPFAADEEEHRHGFIW